MIFFFAIAIPLDAIRTQTFALKSTGEQQAGFLQILRRVDPKRNAVHDHCIDSHAVIERAQLLEPFTLLRGRRS
jgi:hypothetical protein